MSTKIDITSKAFWKSKQGQVTFCILGLLVSVIFLLSQFGGSIDGIFPNASSKDRLERELKKLQQEREKLNSDIAVIDAVRKIADSKLEGAWQVAVHGVPEVELRTKIETAAKTLELRLNNISTVRRTAFNKDMSLLEVDVTVTTDIDTLTRFLLAVDNLSPKLYWRRFDCRSSNMFGMSGVSFNGTLRCVNDERPEAQNNNKAVAAAESNGAEK